MYYIIFLALPGTVFYLALSTSLQYETFVISHHFEKLIDSINRWISSCVVISPHSSALKGEIAGSDAGSLSAVIDLMSSVHYPLTIKTEPSKLNRQKNENNNFVWTIFVSDSNQILKQTRVSAKTCKDNFRPIRVIKLLLKVISIGFGAA